MIPEPPVTGPPPEQCRSLSDPQVATEVDQWLPAVRFVLDPLNEQQLAPLWLYYSMCG